MSKVKGADSGPVYPPVTPPMPQSKDELEQLFIDYNNAWQTAYNVIDPHNKDKHSDFDGMKKVATRSKQIQTKIIKKALSKYISREEVLKAIGEDEVVGSANDAPVDWHMKDGRNQLRAELKHQLGLEGEKP